MVTASQTISQPVVTFVGGGNMAQALIGGLLAEGWPATCLQVAEPQANQRQQLAARGLKVAEQADGLIASSDVVILAVKPQVMPDIVPALGPLLASRLVISIAAGISVAMLGRWIHGGQTADQHLRLVRAMPNTPAMVQTGATGLFAAAGVTEADRQLTERLLGAAGLVLWLDDEQLMHAVTALSGSGPAYFFHLMENMLAAGMALGLDEATARALTLQTALGSAQMALTSSQPPAQLRQQVTSPNGTTQAALMHLQQADNGRIWQEAIRAAWLRSRELAGEEQPAG